MLWNNNNPFGRFVNLLTRSLWNVDSNEFEQSKEGMLIVSHDDVQLVSHDDVEIISHGYYLPFIVSHDDVQLISHDDEEIITVGNI